MCRTTSKTFAPYANLTTDASLYSCPFLEALIQVSKDVSFRSKLGSHPHSPEARKYHVADHNTQDTHKLHTCIELSIDTLAISCAFPSHLQNNQGVRKIPNLPSALPTRPYSTHVSASQRPFLNHHNQAPSHAPQHHPSTAPRAARARALDAPARNERRVMCPRGLDETLNGYHRPCTLGGAVHLSQVRSRLFEDKAWL